MSEDGSIINLEMFRVGTLPGDRPQKSKKRKAFVKQSLDRFLRGPIDMQWLGRASRLPGKALHVGVALWHLSGLKKGRTVKMQGALLGLMGITRQAYSKGLLQLEVAGLVTVERAPGQTPLVTVMDLN